MQAVSFVSQNAQLPASQISAGYSGIALVIAIKTLKTERERSSDGVALRSLAQVKRELAFLAKLPEPDMRRTIRTVLSFLSEEELGLLVEYRHELELSVLGNAMS